MNFALFSGLLLALSFPNITHKEIFWGQGLVAWFCLVPLLLSLKNAGPKAAFRQAYWAGFLFFLLSTYWIRYIGPMGPGVWPAWIALSAYLALYPAVFAWGVAQGQARGWRFEALWIPALWTVLEYGRETLLTGYPWVSLGSSQSLNHFLLPIVSVTGIYGLHYAVALGNVLLWQALRAEPWMKRERLAALAAILLVLGLRFAAQPRPPATNTVKVAVLQGNINEDENWTASFRQKVMSTYEGLMFQAVKAGASVIVMPEDMLPDIFDTKEADVKSLLHFASAHRVSIVLGATLYSVASGNYANAAVCIEPGGRISSYVKRHLVPFGEVIPFRQAIPLLDHLLMQSGVTNFESGHEASVFKSGNYLSSPIVCYESIFGPLVRQSSAGAITLITLDSWFGDSPAPRYHFAQAIFRAVEGGRWVARSAATGISGFIDPQGRIVSSLPLNTAGYLVQDIDCQSQDTLYIRYGAWFVGFCFLLLGLAALFPRKSA